MDKHLLKQLITNDDLEKFFQALLTEEGKDIAPQWRNAVLIQYDQFRQYEKARLQGTLSLEDSGLLRNRILAALLLLIDELPGKEEAPAPLPAAKAESSGRYGKLSGWLIAVAALIVLTVLYLRFAPAVGQRSLPQGPSETIKKEEIPAAALQPIRFPQGDEVTFLFSTGSEIRYRLLNGYLENAGGSVRTLFLTVRCTSRKGNGANFWDTTFRLETDEAGEWTAPSSGLNEVVENNSYKDGTLSFVLNAPFSSLKLVIINPWDQDDVRYLPLATD